MGVVWARLVIYNERVQSLIAQIKEAEEIMSSTEQPEVTPQEEPQPGWLHRPRVVRSLPDCTKACIHVHVPACHEKILVVCGFVFFNTEILATLVLIII